MFVELQFSSIPVLVVAFLVFLFMAVKILKGYKAKSSSTPNLPPGPWQLPLVGNMHQVVGSLIHHTLRDLASKYGPLMHLRLGELSIVVVSSPEMAREIMRTHDIIFASRPSLLSSTILSYNSTNIAFSPYGDYWRQLRRICIMELLSPKRVQTFRAIREEEVLNLMTSISSHGRSPVNLSKRIFALTFGVTARAAFGKKSKHQEAFISIVEEAVSLVAGFNIVDMYPSVRLLQVVTPVRSTFEKMHKRIDEILETIVNEHKTERENTTETGRGDADDLVDVLLRVQKHGNLEFPLTDNNIKAVILDIFSAGSETSSTATEWAISEMLRNPETMKRAQAEVREVFDEKGTVDEAGLHELKYLKTVIKETLRLHPSAPLLLPRECSEKCEINGYEIPVKTRVIVNAWAIGRDPRIWNEAERFVPERFSNSGIDFKGADFEYIPFGAGRRICPGISFALANIELLLAQLLYHFDWELGGGLRAEELDMTEAFGSTVRRKNDLFVVPISYNRSSVKRDY